MDVEIPKFGNAVLLHFMYLIDAEVIHIISLSLTHSFTHPKCSLVGRASGGITVLGTQNGRGRVPPTNLIQEE